MGGELQLERDGRFAASRHDWRFTLAVFRWNDPAGSLLAWRGWSVGDRVTGLRESLRLPQDAGLFGADGVWSRQGDEVAPSMKSTSAAAAMPACAIATTGASALNGCATTTAATRNACAISNTPGAPASTIWR